MADPAPQSPDLQQKYRQFLDLLPLTIALAGLPPSEGRLFGEDQIEGRGITIWRIVNGQITEEWSEFDQLRFMKELGLLPESVK